MHYRSVLLPASKERDQLLYGLRREVVRVDLAGGGDGGLDLGEVLGPEWGDRRDAFRSVSRLAGDNAPSR